MNDSPGFAPGFPVDARHAPARWLLPREAYTSSEWFDREQELIFGRVWQLAGMEDDIPNHGDYLCTQAGASPIVVVRHPDGGLRAFHNICRHRGAQLLEGRGTSASGSAASTIAGATATTES